ncbi:MAG: hypothetical protein LBR41_01980, partial [Rickettsiales bacterium]|nr:hypothetical protein [Rickettsiales bacterium]
SALQFAKSAAGAFTAALSERGFVNEFHRLFCIAPTLPEKDVKFPPPPIIIGVGVTIGESAANAEPAIKTAKNRNGNFIILSIRAIISEKTK